MQREFAGKTAIVTGGGGAIGSAICRKLAALGANVVVTDISLGNAKKVADEIRQSGGNAAALQSDVTSEESMEKLVSETVRLFGSLDCMINNAGINGGPDDRKRIHEYRDNLWNAIVSVDLNGVFIGSRCAAQRMIYQGTGGVIINTSSIVGETPLRLQCAFTAAKAAVLNLTKTMALELAESKIRVNAICPGSIMFEGTRKLFYQDAAKAEGIMSHIPMHQPGEPEDIAGAAAFLMSDEAKYMTGSVMTIDGGWICGYNRDV